MTKNIKKLEQKCLNQNFDSFKMNWMRLLVYAKNLDQNYFPEVVKNTAFGASKQQLIQKNEQKDAEYSDFNKDIKFLKREEMRPVVHLTNHPPMSQKSMTADDLEGSSGTDEYDVYEEDLEDDRPSLSHVGMSNKTAGLSGSTNQKSEKTNMFYLKDFFLKKSDKMTQMKALCEIKNNIQTVMFSQMIKSIISSQEFCRIQEPLIQTELLNSIASSKHFTLLEPLKKLLYDHNRGETYIIPPTILEQLEECIAQLTITKKALGRPKKGFPTSLFDQKKPKKLYPT